MSGMVLLSEIHPLAPHIHNPLRQAHEWFHLFTDAELRALQSRAPGFAETVRLIHRKAEEAGKYPVIRDWSHLDFTGVPFIESPGCRLTLPDKSQHLARHRLADLFLDTFVYNASTTAIDALWAGLSVLTRPGSDFASRICASHVTNVGLGDMVCNSAREFEERAVHLAGDRDALAEIRERLGRNRFTEPLFDTRRFVRHLESAYTAMWERYLSGTAPANIDVPLQH